MKNNKKIVLVALLLTFVLALSVLTACGEPKIELKEVKLGQTTYVLGENLKGSLSVLVDGKEESWQGQCQRAFPIYPGDDRKTVRN